jgi:hypothetical protein
VAGHRGLVGSAVVRRLQAAGFTNLLTATRDQLDLRDQAAVNYWFRANRPDAVFLVAGTVGGDPFPRELGNVGGLDEHRVAGMFFAAVFRSVFGARRRRLCRARNFAPGEQAAAHPGETLQEISSGFSHGCFSMQSGRQGESADRDPYREITTLAGNGRFP